MRVVVQKYGGKCVEPGGNEMVTADRIMETRDSGFMPVVVVSAMGRAMKEQEVENILRQPGGVRNLAMAHFYSTAELVQLVKEIDPIIEPRELDMLMSCGEIISTVRLAHLLKSRGYSTVALSGGQVGLITDGFFGHARVVKTEIRQLLECLDNCTIPFVAGFQGIAPNDHAITTLGEGGSDYTAVCLAYALKHAERSPLQDPIELTAVEIFKDVDGVMTANPANFPADKVSNGDGPRMLHRLTYDELCAMSRYGADVIQAQSAQMARRYEIAVAVRNFRDPDAPGTVIESHEPFQHRPLVTGIADMPCMTVFYVPESTERLNRRISEILPQARVNFLSTPIRDGSWKFAVKKEKYRSVSETVSQALARRGIKPVFEEGQWAVITLVGEGMRGKAEQVGDRARQVLQHIGAEIEGQIFDELSYSILVPEEQRQAAIIALHDEFINSKTSMMQA